MGIQKYCDKMNPSVVDEMLKNITLNCSLKHTLKAYIKKEHGSFVNQIYSSHGLTTAQGQLWW